MRASGRATGASPRQPGAGARADRGPRSAALNAAAEFPRFRARPAVFTIRRSAMSTSSSLAARYTAPARLGHWLVALLIAAAFAIAWTFADLRLSPTRIRLINYHKWVGVTVFGLALLRLAWRAARPPPPLPAAMPAWQRQAAAALHRLLYLLMLAIPLSGWLMSSAKGFQTVYLGKLPIPDLLAKNPPLGAALEAVHVALTWLLLGLLATHVAAALKHHFVDRDEVLARMLPLVRRRDTAHRPRSFR